MTPMPSAVLALLALVLPFVASRPVVRNIRSAHEFDRLLAKHGSETGLPVVVDFYSDSCGPCRMMAPIFKKVAQDFVDKAVFVKVDTNAQYELSGRYQIRSLPTFQWFIGGTKWDEAKGGIGEGPLRQMTSSAVAQAESENIRLSLDDFVAFYGEVDASKPRDDIESVYNKCTDKDKSKGKEKHCQGATAQQLVRKLKKKYKKTPKTTKRFTPEAASSSSSETNEDKGKDAPSGNSSSRRSPSRNSATPDRPNLELATKEQLMAELERRLDEERDAQVEEENDDDEDNVSNEDRWKPSPFPERVVIVGGGPAGMSAAIYAARAGLSPLVIAPSMGGQLQGKGVDVENYPGLHNFTGPAVVSAMRQQAASFGTVFEDDMVVGIDASSRPLKVKTNATGVIETHAVIVATGAESNWLGVPGEYEMRGGGVSACATCDGFLYAGKHVVVIGGGDTAMEEALVLARTSKAVTLIHRRDTFRASKVLANRVIDNPVITIRWNTVVEEIVGKPQENPNAGDEEDIDLDGDKVVKGVITKDIQTGENQILACDAVFVAIGHTPSTSFLQGVVEFDPEHPGYVLTKNGSTKTSVPGIFAAGDVSDSIYRQAVTSAGSGAAAALDAERWLSEEGLGNEAAELEAELMAELMDSSSKGGETNESSGYNVYEDAGGRGQGVKESLHHPGGSEL